MNAGDLSARAYLNSLAMHGIKLGLGNINLLLDAAGRPERAYPCVHVAGTNGKGSVLAFLQAMLRAAGFRVGRFTSPHLLDVTERFQIGGVNMPDAALESHAGFFRDVAAKLSHPPTFFEMNTAIALRYFQEEGVDIALIETGMGGRLDSTNVVAPIVTGITNIGLDHTQYLGDTLELIAHEKAGILKRGIPAVTGETQPGPLAVIRARAAEVRARLRVAGEDFRFRVDDDPWEQAFDYESPCLGLHVPRLGLAGRYQGANAAVALAITELLPRALRPDRLQLAHGLSTAKWPGRMERVLDDPPVIIDVAHNVDGVRELASSVERCVAVLAVSSDKDAAGMIEHLAPLADPLILTAFQGRRSHNVAALSAAAGGIPHETAANLREAIARALPHATRERPLLVTGSIYAAGEARRILMDEYGASAPIY